MKKIIVILVIIILSVLSYLNWIKTHTNDSTTLTVVNEAPYKVKVWLTLSGYPDSVASEYVQNVDSGPDWPADTAMNPRLLQNDSMWKNTGRVGVYPYGCTNCTNTEGRQQCQNPSETPNQYNICNPTRASGVHGGVVRLAFKGYTNLEPLE